MRTLFEIIDSAKSGEMPTHEECYWAMLALSALQHFDREALRRIATAPGIINNAEFQSSESFRRMKSALAQSPKDFVGPENDPANREYQRLRTGALNMLDMVAPRDKKRRAE